MDSMNITSAQYQADLAGDDNSGIQATINGEELFVPLDPANRHYAEIMRQVEAGELVIQDSNSSE